MPYSIQVNSSCGIIRVSYQGRVDFAQRISATDEVCGMVEKREGVKILVDVREINNEMTYEEQEEFGRYVASREEFEKARIAVLHKPGYHPDIIIDTFAYLNGSHVVAFDDHVEAEEWLKGNIK